MNATEHVDTIVIGAGQAGLTTGYHLAKRGQSFVILEENPRVGDVWRHRFDSLRLYSPAQYDGLPGMPMPMARWTWPGKEDMASYLETYAATFELPIRTGFHVDGLAKVGDEYVVSSGDTLLSSANVVVANGGWQTPVTPDFARELDSAIVQLHSSAYRNPSQLQPGPTLVVGCAHSGADIALELAASHDVILSGPVRGEVPIDIEGRRAHIALPILWFLANHVLTERTPMGRKMRHHVRHEGGPLLRVKRAHLEAAGVERIEEKTVAAREGLPVLEGGRVLDVRNVVWCTGFAKDTSWIDFPVNDEDGWPEQRLGAAAGHPGLYFVGLPFQFAFASMLVGGVGRDAEQVAKQIVQRSKSVAQTSRSAVRSTTAVT
jgi:putative flavoprotein involved in K+ transport